MLDSSALEEDAAGRARTEMRAGMEKGRQAAEDGGCALKVVVVTEPVFHDASAERSVRELQP